jgi:hypothetical protein
VRLPWRAIAFGDGGRRTLNRFTAQVLPHRVKTACSSWWKTFKSLPRKVLNDVRQKSHIFKKSLKNLLTKQYTNCIVRLMNDQLRPCRKGGIMKAELRNCKRSANGVVKTTQLRLASLSNQTASQSVAVSRSDF